MVKNRKLFCFSTAFLNGLLVIHHCDSTFACYTVSLVIEDFLKLETDSTLWTQGAAIEFPFEILTVRFHNWFYYHFGTDVCARLMGTNLHNPFCDFLW